MRIHARQDGRSRKGLALRKTCPGRVAKLQSKCMTAGVLYVTFDGVLQPLAFSQSVRVVAGLGSRGLKYHLLSIERPADLARPELTRAVKDMLQPAGVGWTSIAAASMGTPRRVADVLARTMLRAIAIVRNERISLVHARGYHGAVLAGVLKRAFGVPYIFDARGYWIEERTGPGNWFSTPVAYAAGKFVEQQLFRAAEAVVTLTALQATDIASGQFGPPPRHLEVIPTCTDYDAFYLRDTRPAKPTESDCVPREVQDRLLGKLVIGVVGALNSSYCVKEALMLARQVTELNPNAHVLALSIQRREYGEALQAAGIPAERYTVASAEHWTMPHWLQWIDWGLLLLQETAAKRASMPTKLAEFFATGVRPMFFGCNSEAVRWVDRAGSGYVPPSLAESDLRAAARVMTDSTLDYGRLRAAREVSATHFALTAGLERYERFVNACLSRA